MVMHGLYFQVLKQLLRYFLIFIKHIFIYLIQIAILLLQKIYYPKHKPYIPEKVIIVDETTRKKLVGLLHETGSRNIVVMCHGFRSSKESRTIVEITHAMVAQNLSVFRFDFSGNGESDGEFNYSNYWGEVNDLRAVTQYFAGKRRPVSAILGHSKGANVVLLYASKYKDVAMVVNVSGRFHLNQGMKERFGENFMETLKKDGYIDVPKKKNGKVCNSQKKETTGIVPSSKKKKTGKVDYRVSLDSVMERLKINMEASCSQIHPACRVLTVHGWEDEITPLGDAFQFYTILGRLNPNHVLHIIDGANHCYTSHRDQLTAAIISFLRDDHSK